MFLPAHGEGIVIFLDAFVDCFQFVLVCLKPGNIFRSQISVLLDILADDPLTQCGNHLTGLKIYKTKKISCTDIPFVIGKTLLQTADRPGQIPDAGFFQPLIIIKLGKIIHLLLDQYIGSTVRTIIQICIRQERSTVYAVHPLLLILHVCCS